MGRITTVFFFIAILGALFLSDFMEPNHCHAKEDREMSTNIYLEEEWEEDGQNWTTPYAFVKRLQEIHSLVDRLSSSPSSHDILELAIATVTSLDISQDDGSPLVWFMNVGPPGSDKTQRILSLRNCSHTTFIDTLTPNSFLSGYVDDKTKKKAQDLLPLLDGRCLIIKDLTTLFSLRSESVQKILGDLQSIYDGSYAKATGTVGVLSSNSQFTILACITPQALKKHQQYMSSIGGRFLSYGVLALTEDEQALGFDLIWNGTDRREQMTALDQLVVEHVEDVLTSPLIIQPETLAVQDKINRLAELMAAGRSVLDYKSSEYGSREIVGVQTEQPWRGTFQLRNLGRALARVHGRPRLTDHELEMLRRVVLSSIHLTWGEILRLLPAHPEGLTVNKVRAHLGWSPPWCRHQLEELVSVKILESVKVGQECLYYPLAKYQDLLNRPLTSLNHQEDLKNEEKKQ